MKPEQKFWQLLKPHVPGHVVRVENTIASGIPDVNYCYNGKEAWIEIKAGSNLRPSQAAWISKRLAVGGRVLLIERITTKVADYILVTDYDKTEEYEFPKPFDWPLIESILKGENNE